MAKNILVFSDGTGQAGGLRPDQRLSNIYKLYRATRPGPDSPIDPAVQMAFYDAGLGTDEDGGAMPIRAWRVVRKIFSSVTGTGIGRNITDCYAAILRMYEPGDRIYLFGFSRGAYTVRCLANVLSLCGVPTRGPDGGLLPRSGGVLRQIASEAVGSVYEHGARRPTAEVAAQQEEKARRFREKYGSERADGAVDVPYFIGVFDTVAALGLPKALRWAFVLVGAALIGGSYALLAYVFDAPVAGHTVAGLLAALLLLTVAGYALSRVRVIKDYPAPGKWRFTYSSGMSGSYDLKLDTRVRYARHALAIDETRRDFARVGWGRKGAKPERSEGEGEWLVQLWFPGCHSDIGGSYDEDESRLSDISLQWMIDEVQSTGHPIEIDRAKLHLFPSARGMQHCEVLARRERYPSWWPERFRWSWPTKPRREVLGATLHSSVLDRFQAGDVPHAGMTCPYRPETLREDERFADFYEPRHEA